MSKLFKKKFAWLFIVLFIASIIDGVCYKCLPNTIKHFNIYGFNVDNAERLYLSTDSQVLVYQHGKYIRSYPVPAPVNICVKADRVELLNVESNILNVYTLDGHQLYAEQAKNEPVEESYYTTCFKNGLKYSKTKFMRFYIVKNGDRILYSSPIVGYVLNYFFYFAFVSSLLYFCIGLLYHIDDLFLRGVVTERGEGFWLWIKELIRKDK